MKEAIEFLTELEGVLPPGPGRNHALLLRNGGLTVFLAGRPYQHVDLEESDLQRTPAEVVAEIVRRVNALPVLG